MRVSDSHKMLFIHVQKTGGTSIDAMIDGEIADARQVKGVIRHATLRMVLAAEPGLAGHWTFGFVRNPWDRMASWWAMSRDVLDKADAGDQGALKRIAKNPIYWGPVSSYATFDEFVEQGGKDLPRLRRPQLDYFLAPNRRADFIGRQEAFNADLAHVRAHLGLKRSRKAPRENVTKHRPYREYYSDASRKLVAETFARDISEFDYEF